jgi:cobalt-zinc-cadmium efflux system outer membrane protein
MIHLNNHILRSRIKTPFVLLLRIFCIFACLQALSAHANAAGQSSIAPPVIKLNESKPEPIVSPERTLSLQYCFAKANENNKQIIASNYNLPIAEAGIQIARAIPNPQFSLLYGFGPAFKAILAGNPQQFGWQETILTAGKRTKQVNLARANYRLAELQAITTSFSVHNTVRRAYAELAAAEAYDNLTEAEIKSALDLTRVSQARFQSGKVSRSELLQAELGVMQFDTQRNLAQLRLQQDTAALALLIGEIPTRLEVIDVDDNGLFKLSAQHTDLVPQPIKNLPALKDLLALAEQVRADFQVNVQQAYTDRRALTIARAQRIPNISLDSGYQFTTFTPVQPYHLYSGLVPNSPGCYFNISAEFPIFYHYQGETSQAKAVWSQDFDQLDQFKWQMSTDIIKAYEAIRVTRANIGKFQKDLVPAAAQVEHMAYRRYQTGKGDLSSAILAKQQYQQTLSSYFDAVVAYQNAWADLEQAVGVPLQL